MVSVQVYSQKMVFFCSCMDREWGGDEGEEGHKVTELYQ